VREALGLSTHSSLIYPFGQEKLAVVESSKGRYAGGYYEDNLCYAPYLHLFIAWDGNTYLCCMTNGRIESLGNVADASVSDIFKGERFSEVRHQMENERLKACHACDMFLEENRTLARALTPSPASTA
jgi:radical SAM protein with 4Fe4S-binding SPASM domain